MNNNKPVVAVIITLIVILLLCVACMCIVVVGGISYFGSISDGIEFNPLTDINLPTTITFPAETPSVSIDEGRLEAYEIPLAQQTLDTLNQVIVPINDPIELAERLAGKSDVPDVLIDTEAPYEVGARKSFWVTNTDNNQNFQVEAVLRFVGENIYFWIEDGVSYKANDLERLATTFDLSIIPTNREFFGSEWNPGVDGDPRFYILYAGGLGNSVAGYYSSADQLHPEAHPFSNAHEMFLMNSDAVGLGETYIYGTMAHEFQHMIHWYQDKNEETWVNEGFSMLAEHVNDYDAGGFDYEYMINPDMQLNDWGGETGQNGPHYGASYLFMVYFLDRFGEEATKALVSHDENGFASIDKVAQELNLINPGTGQVYKANEIFADWAVANLIQNTGIEEGRYDYRSYSPFSMDVTETVYTCPTSIDRDVFQYGVDYIEFDCSGEYTIEFNGSQSVDLLPIEAPSSGQFYYWSNAGDESNPSLSQTFDLSSASGEISLNFKTWYDLETDYDYVYISATTDELNWQILDSLNCTTSNPSGNSYGCGWNGQTDQWIPESVDLSEFAGQKITLRFDYVTDAAVNGRGMALDDFRIDAIGYASDLEGGDGGWVADGFVRVQNKLSQSFSLSLVTYADQITVEHLQPVRGNQYEINVEIGDDVEKVILVVSGTTPVTREKAAYRISVR